MAKKLKVPKKIAGVKVPKQLRGKTNSGQRELAAAALIAVAGALLSNKKVRAVLAEAGDKAAKEGAKAAAKAASRARTVAKDATRSALAAAESTAKRLAKNLDKGAAAPEARKPRNAVETVPH